jgi:hypothetical protein
MDPRVERIVDFLNDQQIRATYAAVGGAIGFPAQSVGRLLGGRQPRASWVVAKKTRRPTGYTASQMHAALQESEVILTANDLRRRMSAWDRAR